jgi:hypothetical protein
MSNPQFGSGVLYGRPNAGNLAANPTPMFMGVLQEASIDIKGDLKKLKGQNQMPIAQARASLDVTVKAKFATMEAKMINQLYFGQAESAGINLMAGDEKHAVAASVNATNKTTFVTDWGVRDAATGKQFTKVTGAPAAGQYACDGSGVYTFAAGETVVNVLISYTYADTTRGTTITLMNQAMGYAPEFGAFLYNNFRNKYFGVELFDCTMGSCSLPTKLEDFWIMDVDFSASADASGLWAKMYFDN